MRVIVQTEVPALPAIAGEGSGESVWCPSNLLLSRRRSDMSVCTPIEPQRSSLVLKRVIVFFALVIPCTLLGADARSIAVIPVAAPFFTPETSYGLGVYTLTVMDDQQLTLYATGTTNRQYSVGLMTELYLRERQYAVNGIVEASRFPSTVWDIGPNSREASAEAYTPEQAFLRLKLLRRLGSSLYTGPAVRLCSIDIRETEAGGLLDRNRLHGSAGSVEAGFGWGLSYDDRDAPFFPRRGSHLESTVLYYPSVRDGEGSYLSAEGDYRRYIPLLERSVLAVHARLQTTSGDVPFQSLPKLGGSDIMRGLDRGRYRDHTALAFQGEARFPLLHRFEGVLFSAAGCVASDVFSLPASPLRTTWGGGIRFVVDTDNHIVARLDAGFNGDGRPHLYFLVNQAF